MPELLQDEPAIHPGRGQQLQGLHVTGVREQGLYLVCVLDAQAPLTDNPEYEHIPDVYKLPPLKFVGFELWQARQLICVLSSVA